MSFYLAMDAGGTKTTGVLADETRVLARASTGTIKLMRVGEEEASQRLRGLMSELSLAAGISLSEVKRTCLGISGLTIEAVRQWARREIGEVVGGELLLCGDEEIAFEGAFKGGEGILLIAGTGSNLMGRTADGTKYNIGGWGPALGDEGSGYWIGVEAIRAGFWALDRDIPTTLLKEFSRFWDVSSLGELVEKANERPSPDFAALAPLVVKCAEQGDELAMAVLERAGEELAEQISLMSLKMLETGTDGEIGLAYTGSVIEHIGVVRESMIRALARTAPRVKAMSGTANSLEGALWMARGGKAAELREENVGA
jgi:N-acetylglucosamine kinase-like BadF-type ATPase